MYKKNSLALCIALIAAGSSQVFAQEPTTSSNVDEVVISGVREAELNAREAERAKNIFSSVIAQDDAGNFADQNVAESLQRLPGVTLQKEEGEGKFVSVRGLGPGFVAVSMNGNELASASSDTRAFALDALPSDMLGSIEVFKSLTPDMDLNSIAGIVNVKTVSAFDKKKDTLKATFQESYQNYSGEYSPKIAIQGTNLFLDKTIGVGYTLSYENRGTETYQVRHHTDNPMEYRTDSKGNSILAPNQLEARQEEADRKRVTGSFDLGYRPNDESEYFLRASRTDFEDMDVALREYYRFDTATGNENVYVDPTTGTFGVADGELQQQYFLQKGTATTTALSLGGKNTVNDSWHVDYAYAYSKGEFSKPDGSRVQFRLQDVALLGQAGKDYIAGQIISQADLQKLSGLTGIPGTGGKFQAGESTQSNMTYDNLFIEDSFRDDTVNQFNLNLKKDFEDSSLNYIKTGLQIKNRDRVRNKDRWSVVPYDLAAGCEGDALCVDLVDSHLSDFETYKPNSPDFTYNFITRSETEKLLAATSKAAKWFDPDRTDQESRKEDYQLTEDTSSAYLMAEWQLTDASTLIAGARYESTEFTSSGYFTVRNDRFEGGAAGNANYDIAIPLVGAESKYSDLLPSIHYRYELNEETLFRAALWTSFTRPSFDQARAFAEIDGRVNLCSPDLSYCGDDPKSAAGTIEGLESFSLNSNNVMNFGNPTLKAMNATNFDSSITWYASEDLFIQAAVFYKDIKDFIVAVRGSSMRLDQLPIQLPIDQVTQFIIPSDLVINNVNWSINGEKAKVYGAELSYSQYFDNGLFVQSNLTLMKSDAKVGDSIRVGSIPLPEQANETANLTFGWENDDFSVRLIGNYRGKVLKEIGSCPSGATTVLTCKTWSDIYDDATVGYDFKATYKINSMFQIYFDALNLTDEHSLQYFTGNSDSRGKSLYVSEAWGRSYQLGVNVKFF